VHLRNLANQSRLSRFTYSEATS